MSPGYIIGALIGLILLVVAYFAFRRGRKVKPLQDGEAQTMDKVTGQPTYPQRGGEQRVAGDHT